MKKKIYNILTILFIIISTIELIIYLINESNYYALYYLIINTLIITNLLFNYKTNKKTKLKKNITNLILVIFNNYILFNLLTKSYSFKDYSINYINKINILRILKLLITTSQVIISLSNIYKIKVKYNKINKHN